MLHACFNVLSGLQLESLVISCQLFGEIFQFWFVVFSEIRVCLKEILDLRFSLEPFMETWLQEVSLNVLWERRQKLSLPHTLHCPGVSLPWFWDPCRDILSYTISLQFQLSVQVGLIRIKLGTILNQHNFYVACWKKWASWEYICI